MENKYDFSPCCSFNPKAAKALEVFCKLAEFVQLSEKQVHRQGVAVFLKSKLLYVIFG